MIDIGQALAISQRAFPQGPEVLAAHLGIRVTHTKLTGCAGWCLRHQTRAVIRINSNIAKTRQRFTLAHDSAAKLLEYANGSRTNIYRMDNGDNVTVASVLPRENSACLFIQVLPREIGIAKTSDEVIMELGQWLFASDQRFRGAVNGCLSSFKSQAVELDVQTALAKFNAIYLLRWTDATGDRIRDPRGQQFLRLRLQAWCRPSLK